MNKNKPPKNRDFLALVDTGYHGYWDIFFWATREDGVNGKACYVDRQFYAMPNIRGWVDLPEIEEDSDV